MAGFEDLEMGLEVSWGMGFAEGLGIGFDMNSEATEGSEVRFDVGLGSVSVAGLEVTTGLDAATGFEATEDLETMEDLEFISCLD